MAPMRGRLVSAVAGAAAGPAASRTSRSTSLMKIVVGAQVASDRSARNHRSRFGTEMTHWQTGTGGMISPSRRPARGQAQPA